MLKELDSLNQYLMDGLTDAEKIDLFTEDYVQDISLELHKVRVERNMTQSKFAKLLGVSQPMVSKLESLEYNPTIKKLVEICYKLGLKLTISIEKQKADSGFGNNFEQQLQDAPKLEVSSAEVLNISPDKQRQLPYEEVAQKDSVRNNKVALAA